MESLCGKPPSPAMAVEELFKERNDFILIGLTGRTGSGCTTVSKILAKKDFKDLRLPPPYETDFTHTDQRKFRVIHHYLAEHWKGFTAISMTAVISTFILQATCEELIARLKEIGFAPDPQDSTFHDLESLYDSIEIKEFVDLLKNNLDDRGRLYHSKDKYKNTITVYYQSIVFWEKLEAILKQRIFVTTCNSKSGQNKPIKNNLYSSLFQAVGNNIRVYGSAFGKNCESRTHMFDLACRANDIIQAVRLSDKEAQRPTHICIDAIRNPYEAMFFQDRYTAFYLVSINTTEIERLRRLSIMSKPEIDCLDNAEYSSNLKGLDSFTKQDIAACIQLSDIHLNNPQCETEDINNPELTKQIVRYVCLMMHPGLVTPTAIERCMQVAFNAKLNSGCLSRQVGAVITDKDFSVKAIGWNDVACGQIPCNLRDIRALCQYHDRSSHSRFELEDENFQNFILKRYKGIEYDDLKGRLFPYCFSEVFNAEKAEELNEKTSSSDGTRIQYIKNQVYTRSLHAEENAFLQITKYGGEGIQGGNLFVTASPCELCSKKSYQLGIKHIYYIDPYPGIAKEHILDFSRDPDSNPELHIFTGAIGRAYIQLYIQKISYKDELSSLLDNNVNP